MRIVSLYRGTSKRSAERLRTILSARALWLGAAQPITCTVRDISSTGAKVLVSAVELLPGQFDLHIVDMQVAVHVRVMWRRFNYVGVAFIGAPRSMTELGEDLI